MSYDTKYDDWGTMSGALATKIAKQRAVEEARILLNTDGTESEDVALYGVIAEVAAAIAAQEIGPVIVGALTVTGVVTAAGFTSAAGVVSLGASPPASGAIRVDAASYGNRVLSMTNAPMNAYLELTNTNAFRVMGGGSTYIMLGANGLNKWRVYSEAAGIATLGSEEATARIIGGVTNGLAIRNSANTRDNFAITDAGTAAVLNDGTNTAAMSTTTASGETYAGAIFRSSGSGQSATLTSNTGTGSYAAITYYNNTTALYQSALEIQRVASGFGTLALMKSGGAVVIGTDPGGTSLLRVGGNITTNTTLSGAILRATGAASGSAGTVTFGTSTQTTVGAAGGASALPATPTGFLRFYIGTSEKVLPYYDQA